MQGVLTLSVGSYARAVTLPVGFPYMDPLGRAPGESLDKKFRTDEQWEAYRRTQIPADWFALYQQNPRVEGGNLLGRKDFFPEGMEARVLPHDLFESRTEGVRWNLGTDFAYSSKHIAKGDPDYTAGCLMGWRISEGGDWYNVYIKEVWQQQESWSDTKLTIARYMATYGDDTWLGGQANGPQKAAMDDIENLVELANYTKRVVPTLTQDKLAFAQPWIDHAKRHRVWLQKANWNSLFFDHMEIFPFGSHDDIADAVSVAWRLCQMRGVEVDTKPVVGKMRSEGRWS